MSEGRITSREIHARLAQLEQHVTNLMCGPNLTDGMVHAIRSADTNDALQARLSLSNAVITAPQLLKNPLDKDLHITGRVGGHAKRRRQAVGDWGMTGAPQDQANLMYPATRPGRPRGTDGGRSFHMKEVIIHAVKAGSRSQKKARQNYALDASKVPHIEAALAGQHLERGIYLFRPQVAAGHGETLLAVTSMGPTDEGIVSQWQLIERTEIRKVKPVERHLSIDLTKSTDTEFWKAIQQKPGIPKALLAFLKSNEEAVRFTGKDCKSVERFLRKHEWHDQKATRKRKDITFHRGRKPVIQRRLVFELPSDLPLDAVERIIHELAKEFTSRKLPFVLVVHRPDEHNDPGNWHIHLDYHHRPMERFDPATYQLEPVPLPRAVTSEDGKIVNEGEKKYAQYCIKQAALAEADKSWTGKWDCEIEYDRHTPCGKKKKDPTYPFIQDTHPDFRKEGEWIKNLRIRYADIINVELQRANLPDRFDPRDFESRNIDKIPDAHLSNSKTRLERSGRPTLEGAMNEQCQWDYEVSELRKRHPIGSHLDGDPVAVAKYASEYIALLLQRLRSRSHYVLKYSEREANYDSQPNPTVTSQRRQSRRDYRPEWLEMQSRAMLRRIDDIWPSLTRGIHELALTLTKRASDKKPLAKTDAPSAKPATVVPASQKPAPKKNNSPVGATDQSDKPVSANQMPTTSAPALASQEYPSVLSIIGKLRRHKAPFKFQQRYSETGKKLLFAELDQKVAEAKGLPVRFIAQTAKERSELLSLQRDRMDACIASIARFENDGGDGSYARAPQQPSIKERQPTQDAVKQLPQRSQSNHDTIVSHSKRRLTEPTKPVSEDKEWVAAWSKEPGRDVRPRRADENSFFFAKDIAGRKPSARTLSTGPSEDAGPQTNAQQQGLKHNHPPQPVPAVDAAVATLIDWADQRRIVLYPGPDGYIRFKHESVNSPDVSARMAERSGQDRLRLIADAQHEELGNLAVLAAVDPASVKSRENRTKAADANSASLTTLMGRWANNEDVQQALDQMARLSAPNPQDHEELGRRRDLFPFLVMRNQDAFDEIERMVAAECCKNDVAIETNPPTVAATTAPEGTESKATTLLPAAPGVATVLRKAGVMDEPVKNDTSLSDGRDHKRDDTERLKELARKQQLLAQTRGFGQGM